MRKTTFLCLALMLSALVFFPFSEALSQGGGNSISIAVSTDRPGYSPGDRLVLTISVANIGGLASVDQYIGLQAPGGVFFIFDGEGLRNADIANQASFVPSIRSLQLQPRSSTTYVAAEFDIPSGALIPDGQYTWYAGYTLAGTLNFVALNSATFLFHSGRATSLPTSVLQAPPPAGVDISGLFRVSGETSGSFTIPGEGGFFSGGRSPNTRVTIMSEFLPDSSTLRLSHSGNDVTGEISLLEDEGFEVGLVRISGSVRGTSDGAGGISLRVEGTFEPEVLLFATQPFSGSLQGRLQANNLSLAGVWTMTNNDFSFDVLITGSRIP